MDKYTIDLDKVLNDFEYSELTEENNFSSTTSVNQNQPNFNYVEKNFNNLTPASKSTNLTTKHSINNVFHSLNEYLNSDIKDFKSPDLSEINEIESVVPTFVSKPQTSIQDIFKEPNFETPENYEFLRQPSSNTTLSYVNSRTTITPQILNTDSKQSLIDCDFNPESSENPHNLIEKADSVETKSSESDQNILENDPNVKNEFENQNFNKGFSESRFDDFGGIPRSSFDAFGTIPSGENGSKSPGSSDLSSKASEIDQEASVDNFSASEPTFNPKRPQKSLEMGMVSLDEIDFEPQTLKNEVEPEIEPSGIEIRKNSLDVLNNETFCSESPSSNPIFMRTNTTTSISTVKSNRTFIDNHLRMSSEPQNCIMSPNSKQNNVENDENVGEEPQSCVSSPNNESVKVETNIIDVPENYQDNSQINIKSDTVEKIGDSPLEPRNSISTNNKNNIRSESLEKILDSDVVSKMETLEIGSEGIKNNQNGDQKLIPEGLNIGKNSFEGHDKNLFDDPSKILPDQTYSDSETDQNSSTEPENFEIKNDLTKNTNLTINKGPFDPFRESIEVSKSNIEKYDYEISSKMSTENFAVGFDHDFEVSDTEMENELEKLENEYKEKISMEKEIIEKIEGIYENETDIENIKEIEKNVNNSFKEEICESTVIKSDMNLVDNGLSQNESSNDTEKNPVNIETESKSINSQKNQNFTPNAPNYTSETQNLNIESENFASKTPNFTLGAPNFDMETQNLTSETQTLTSETQIEASNEIKENFVLQRPNSLDISENSESTNTINLIGSPGSTPFNNMYVENSLDIEIKTPEKPPKLEESLEKDGEFPKTETETEYLSPKEKTKDELNNSLSPTVSEVSTSEVSDSPNTSDSCNDTSLDDNLNDSLSKNMPNVSSSLNQSFDNENNQNAEGPKSNVPNNMLGKMAPFWTPDSEAMNCLHCNLKFTVVKRRHHCRACGLVLCSKCCYLKYKLEYMDNQEARVCTKCYEILSGEVRPSESSPSGTQRPLNPANPMDYCSTVPPLQQVGNLPVTPPTVMVPVGVLKRKGSGKTRSAKSVMFCDGIRPGCDLTELDYDFNYKATQTSSKVAQNVTKPNRNLPKVDQKTNSYIPNEDNCLPPTVNILKSEITYSECANSQSVVEMLKNESLIFAIQRNLHVHVKLINMDCCINKQAWCFTTEGMIAVGQDEIIILLEVIENEKTVPKDVFLHLNNIYNEAVKGTSITELGLSIHNTSNFLESKNHAGFLYIKPSFQCTQNLIIPKEPYLIGVLIHRWETPWAKIFPLRLLLRLGAEYRYYPSPIISTRHRESVYVEIGHTIINLLADFRNFSYTLPNVRGLTIHMTEKNTTVSIPQNRYDQVMKALNNSSDHILAFSANFSPNADSHLVCIQDTQGNNENSYTTHAINIQNKPRKVTGASFIVLNGALKSSSGLTAKSSIVEDGLMIQILPEQMVKLRNSLRNMKDFKINCGCVNAQSDEFVNIIWTENDVNFNVGVVSPIDNKALSGVPSIRVHNGKDYVCNSGNKMIRWTEVFIVQSGDENNKTQDPVDISKISENISKATCQALVKYLDLLATNSFLKIGIRAHLHEESVSYLAGSNGVKLPPIYMKSLDNELIPVLHKISSNNLGDNAMVVELIFHILNM